MMIDRDAVIWCYRLLLGREPENEAAVAYFCNEPDLPSFVERTLQSPEFKARYGSTLNLSKSWVWTEISDNALLRVNLSDLHVSWQAIEGVFERNEANFMKKIIRPDWTVLDVGANIGYFSILMGSIIGANGRLHSFEPMPVLFDSLSKSIGKNGFNDRATLHNMAVSDANGSASILSAEVSYNWGGSRIVPEHAPIPPGHAVQQVNIGTLDQTLDLDKLDFIKIDIEGHEFAAIQGARRTLEMHRPIILSEVAPDLMAQAGVAARDYVHFVESLGYRCHYLSETADVGDLVAERGIDTITNVVFVPI